MENHTNSELQAGATVALIDINFSAPAQRVQIGGSTEILIDFSYSRWKKCDLGA